MTHIFKVDVITQMFERALPSENGSASDLPVILVSFRIQVPKADASEIKRNLVTQAHVKTQLTSLGTQFERRSPGSY